MAMKYEIKQDISLASTLPSSFYRDSTNFLQYSDKLISSSWQFIGDKDIFEGDKNLTPIAFYDGLLNEPLLLTKEQNGDIKCLSNVCTHRGNLLINKASKSKTLLCGYHGRRFNLKGEFEFMPEFDNADEFPRACDDLHKVGLEQWNQFLFVGLEPNFNFNSIANALNDRVGFLDFDKFRKAPTFDKDYEVAAHWALYCDNYLEGFHIPFVHPALNQAVEYNSYETILYDYCNLQIGYAKPGVEAFDLPNGHPDYGKNVAAYYYWIFPNLMMNFYPWGLSINLIKPVTNAKTQVKFITYVLDESKIESSAGAELNQVELEDEEVVQSVQHGMSSRFYTTGRFSPTKEQGVHHFHRLIADLLNSTV
jgi:choline monooxygenase